MLRHEPHNSAVEADEPPYAGPAAEPPTELPSVATSRRLQLERLVDFDITLAAVAPRRLRETGGGSTA